MTKTLTIYFEGTSNSLRRLTTQIALFARLTAGYNLNNLQSSSNYDDEDHYHLSFDGCGVTNGLLGVLFATGLLTQCNQAVQRIQEILSATATSSPSTTSAVDLIVNIVGLSRGGIAVIYLTQLLHKRISDINKLQINLLLFDPVPGNLIWTTKYLDLCSFTTANSAMNLSKCHHIHDILALYPYLPLPDFAFHAPLFPKYPSNCHEIIEDACLGCHQGVLFCQPFPECRLSFTRITTWLMQHGTKFVPDYLHKVIGLYATLPECIEIMDANLRSVDSQPEIRYGHSTPSGVVIRRNLPHTALYLNKWHKELLEQHQTESPQRSSQVAHEYLLEITR